MRQGVLAATLVAVLAVGFASGFWVGSRLGPPPVSVPSKLPEAVFSPVGYDRLEGWTSDPLLLQALPALKISCAALANRDPASTVGHGEIARSAKAWQKACGQVVTQAGNGELRAAIETAFQPYAVATSSGATQGVFTGYYEAELSGSLVREGRFQVPIYGVPHDLITVDVPAFVPDLPAGVPHQLVGRITANNERHSLVPYFSREEIDAKGAVAGNADVLVWADDAVAVHILHIQGSGRVTLPDGRRLRLSFAAHNGQHFKGIGSILIAAGVLKPGEATMDNVRAWLETHPADAARYMNQNARYIFFRATTGDDPSGPIGALGVPLTPGRSLAVDTSVIPLGAPLWLETSDPDGVPLHRLMSAQDTGAAITGPVRGDFFWGLGETAFAKAARMKSSGRYMVLIPREPS